MLPPSIPSLQELEAIANPGIRLNNSILLLDHLLKQVDAEHASTGKQSFRARLERQINRFSRQHNLVAAVNRWHEWQRDHNKIDDAALAEACRTIHLAIKDLLPLLPSELVDDVLNRHQKKATPPPFPQAGKPPDSVSTNNQDNELAAVVVLTPAEPEGVLNISSSSAISPRWFIAAAIIAVLFLAYFWRHLSDTPDLSSSVAASSTASSRDLAIQSPPPSNPPPGTDTSGKTSSSDILKTSAEEPIKATRSAITTTRDFREDFVSTREGELPEIFTGDPYISVRRRNTSSWLESSTDATQRVTVPVQVAGDFDLRLTMGFESYSTLTYTLTGSGPPLRVTVQGSDDAWEITIADSEEQRSSRRFQSGKERMSAGEIATLRFVREGRTCYACVQTRRIVLNDVDANATFDQLAVSINGRPKAGHIHRLVISQHPRPLHRRSLPYRETFDYADGTLPENCHIEQPDYLAVRRDPAFKTHWLQRTDNDERIVYLLETLPLQIPATFTLDMNVGIPRYRTLIVLLGGVGKFPDIPLTIKNGDGSYVVHLADAAAQSFKADVNRPVWIQLQREGAVFKVIHNDQTVVVGPRNAEAEIETVGIGLVPGVQLHCLSLRDSAHLSAASLATLKPASQTLWKPEYGTSQFHITRHGDTLDVSLAKSFELNDFKATLHKTIDDGVAYFSGTGSIVFSIDETQQHHPGKMKVRVVSATELEITADNIELDRQTGRILSRKESVTTWARVD